MSGWVRNLRRTRSRSHARRGMGAALLLLLVSGCGYKLEGTVRTGVTKDVRTMAVSGFVNRTAEPGLERTMEDATRNKFIQDGRVQVVSAADAQAVLDAIIQEYRLIPIGFSRDDEVRRFRVFIRTRVRVRDQRKGKTLIDQIVDIDSEFETSANISSSDQSRRSATQSAADLFASDVISLILEGF